MPWYKIALYLLWQIILYIQQYNQHNNRLIKSCKLTTIYAIFEVFMEQGSRAHWIVPTNLDWFSLRIIWEMIISVTLNLIRHLHYIYNIAMLKLNNNRQKLKGLSHVESISLLKCDCLVICKFFVYTYNYIWLVINCMFLKT